MKRAGFTLIELMIVVGLLAVMASIAVTSANQPEAQRLEAVGRSIAADLRSTRAAAIRYGTSYTVQFDPQANGFEVVHSGTGSRPLPEQHLKRSQGGRYLVLIDRIGSYSRSSSGVQLTEVKLATSGLSVSDLTFGPQGGTGPARSEDTLLRLEQSTGNGRRLLELRVSWITGQVWLGDIASSP